MAIAWDASSNAIAGTGNFSFTHTPVGTPKGIVVMICESASGVDGVTGVTYGGVTCNEIANSPALLDFAEKAAIHVFFLGANIPAGPQTVAITVSGVITRRPVCWSYTATANRTEIVDSEQFVSVSSENPSVTLSHFGRDCCDGLVGIYGGDTVGSVVNLANWNTNLEEDFGTTVGVWYPTVASSTADRVCGWTAVADDATFIAFAIGEVVPTGGSGGGKGGSGGGGGKPPSGGGGGGGINGNQKVRGVMGQRRKQRRGLLRL